MCTTAKPKNGQAIWVRSTKKALRRKQWNSARHDVALPEVFGAAIVAAGLAAAFVPALAQSGDPIKIGFSMALTGPLSPNGKQALLGAKIWEEEINAKGGLLGRKVELMNYDDQSNPANVPGIYTKLIEIDKVDMVMGPYGTNLNAPALPVVMQKGKTFIGFFALDINAEFHYPKYFSMLPTGPTPREAFTEGYFQSAAAQKPKPQTDRTDVRGRRVCAQRLRRRPRERQDISASTSSTTRLSLQARPTSPRSSALFNPSTPIWWLFAPIR